MIFFYHFREKVQYIEEGGRRKQFHGFFIIINNDNCIVKFALTKSGKLSELNKVFKSVSELSSIEAIFSDQCCHDRASIQKVFAQSLVKLDVFHATNRLIRAFTHKSPVELTQFSHDVKFIVRKKNDRYNERTMPTASPDVILENIQELKKTWISSLTKETEADKKLRKEIDNLSKHAKAGCMSDIPVSMGTHLNENIHRQFSAFLNDRRSLSLEMFIALFTVFALKHNRKITKNPLPIISKPIASETYGKCSFDGYGLIHEDANDATANEVESQESLEILVLLNNVMKLEIVCQNFHLLNKTRLPEFILACCPWQGKTLPCSYDLLEKYCLDFSRNVIEEKMSFMKAVEKMCKINATKDYLEKVAQDKSGNKTNSIQDILEAHKCDYSSSKSVALMCDALGVVLIVITGNVVCPIQCMVPSKVLSESPLILAAGEDGFHLTMISSTIATSGLASKWKRCRCVGSCTKDTNCSCFNAKVSCNDLPR